MAKIILQGFIVVPKQDREAILTELQHHIKMTLAEEGCIKFEIRPDIASDENGKYWVYEEFVSREAFNLHQARVKTSNWGHISKTVERHYDPIIEVKENPFNFDLDSIQKSIESGFKPVPKFDTAEQLADNLRQRN